jgi:uncharacterized protein YigA (DUF484 family)
MRPNNHQPKSERTAISNPEISGADRARIAVLEEKISRLTAQASELDSYAQDLTYQVRDIARGASL